MMAEHPVKTYRKQHKLTQKRFGDMIPVSRTTVARWEAGDRQIDQELLPKVSEQTGIPAKELRPDLAELLKDGAA